MKAIEFFRLHNQEKPLILANAWDAGSARIFEDLGAKAIATSSAAVAWALGYRDGYQLPSELQVQVAERITRVIKVPLSVDFENGYSDDPKTVGENIKALLDVGVAGINIEDGRDNPELLARKIDAIRNVAENNGSKFFINARTDVYLASLVAPSDRAAEVIRREGLYLNAGANGLFVPVLTNEQEITQIVERISLPLNVMSMPGLPNAQKLGELGVKRLSAGGNISTIVWGTAARLATGFLDKGDSSIFDEEAMSGGILQGLFPEA